MAGGRIEIDVEPNLDDFPDQMESGLQGAAGTAKKVGAAIGAAFGGASIAAGLKASIDIGVEFDGVLNQIRGTSGATADEMTRVSDTARALGNDLSLPGTSATDAASAMLELSKGGLSVQQSMDAAKGSLALAAAAQIDAASAATIQADAINTFSLNAGDAARVADVLSNAANSSSAEITDIAQGLSQGGAVAKQFGLSIEDTASTLALLASNGIKGSDAGTLLKSTLLALTDQGKPATAAMEELGLSVYDAQGRFVGMKDLFGQLEVASKRMTPEAYQAATAVLFGSDAMRLSGVAASSGAAGYDKFRQAIGEQGTAARLAAEINAGVPGGLEAIGNAAEQAGLQVYDLIRGPLNTLTRGGAQALTSTSTAITGGIKSIADEIRSGAPQYKFLRDTFESLKDVGGNAAAGAREIASAVADAAKGDGGPGALGAAGTAVSGVASVTATASGALRPLGSLVGGVVSAFASLPGPVQAGVLALGAFRLAQSRMSTGLGGATRQLDENGQATRRWATASGEQVGRVRSSYLGLIRGTQQFRSEMSYVNATNRTALRYTDELGRTTGQAGRQLGLLAQAQRAYGISTVPPIAAARSFTNQIGAIRTGAAAAGAPISALAASTRALSERGGNLGAIATSYTRAASGAGRLGAVAGTAAAGMTATRIGASGLMGALGGPFGLAIAGASIGLAAYAQRQQKAAQAAAEHKATVDGLAGSLDAATGKLNQAGREQVVKSLQGEKAFDRVDRLPAPVAGTAAVTKQNVTDASTGNLEALRQVNAALDAQVQRSLVTSQNAGKAWQMFGDGLKEAGVSTQDLTAALRGNEEATGKVNTQILAYNARTGETIPYVGRWREMLDGAGRDAVKLGESIGRANDNLTDAQKQAQQQAEAMGKASPRAQELAGAMRVLADSASSAADKASALKAIMDGFAGAQGYDQAVGNTRSGIEQLPAAWQAAADAAGGYASVIDAGTGRIAQTSEATRALSTSLYQTSSSYKDVASAAYEAALKQGASQEQARDAAVTAAGPLYQSLMQTADGARQAGVDVNALFASLGILPPDKLIPISTPGSELAVSQLRDIQERLNSTPDLKPITVQSLSDEARSKLQGIKDLVVTELPDGKGVTIDAKTEAARAAINDLLKTETKTINVYTNEQAFGGVNDPSGQQLRERRAGAATGGVIPGLRDGGPFVTSGAVRGPGTGTSDSVVTTAAAGGHVFTAAETAAAGGADRVLALIGASSSSRKASGAMQPVALSNGETYIAPGDVDAAGGHGRLFQLRAALRAGLPRRGLGGLINVEKLGKQNDGLPYITGARDCSMWVSWILQAAKGLPLGRLFTTYSLLGGTTAGLVPGASRSDLLSVGVSQEHMAATVMTDRGPVDTESGGGSSPSQVRWGRGAAGAFDAQFPQRFHLPVELINPRPTTAEEDAKAKAAGTDTTATDSTKSGDSTSSTDDSTTSKADQVQRIEAPKVPKLEDVAGEAAKIGVRGLLDTFDLGDSIFANPESSTLAQGVQIGINTERYRREQAENPDDSETDATGKRKKKGKKSQHDPTDPDGLHRLLQYGTYTDDFEGTFKLPRQSAVVTALLKWARGRDNKKSKTVDASALSATNDPDGVKALMDGGQWTPRFGTAFGAQADSALVKGLLKERGKLSVPGVKAFADGGISALPAAQAAIVPPNTLRVIGDRQANDEFFIPDTNEARHVAIGAEWARRRGYALVSMFNDGAVASSSGAAMPAGAVLTPGGDTFEAHYHFPQGGDPYEQSAAARRDERIRRQNGLRQGTRKGSTIR